MAAAAEMIPLGERLSAPLLYHPLPLVTSALVGALLGLLGCFVVLRRMALIGDAISHAVLPGVVVAFLVVSTGLTGLFIGALVAGVLTAVGIKVLTRFSRVKDDAAIGIVFTAMFAIGVILISYLPSGTHFDLKCFLFGDPLAVGREDLLCVLTVAPLAVLLVVLLYHPLKLLCFDEQLAATLGFRVNLLHYGLMVMLAAAVVAALRSVGVIMAVAMLVTPAALAYQVVNRFAPMLALASIAGAFSAIVGMFLAFLVNAPPGPVMVLVATVLFGLAVLFGPQSGVIPNWLRHRRMRRHIVEEDLLNTLIRGARGDLVSVVRDRSHLPGVSASEVEAAVRRLVQHGHLRWEGDRPVLTPSGEAHARTVLRAHRLWETLLAERTEEPDVLHAEAERLEHIHDVADELAATLGHPQRDPQGKPIPPPARPNPPDEQQDAP